MGNPVAAGLSRITLINMSREENIETQIVLEVYDGDNRIQIEFEDLEHFREVIQREPEVMMDYFRNNLFDSPEMDDPLDALLKMAAASGDDGLVTVPPEDDDEELFSAMTTIFQNVAELNGDDSGSGGTDPYAHDGDFIQSLVRDQENGEES
ncbi:MAG: hypothetical protein ABEK50_01765 [bacterium]